MDLVSLLILVTGCVRVITALYLGKMAYDTWNNPHPSGRKVMPEFITIIGLIFINDGLRAISFYDTTEPVGQYMEPSGIANQIMSHILTLILCVMMLYRTRQVQREFTSDLK